LLTSRCAAETKISLSTTRTYLFLTAALMIEVTAKLYLP
jgi:hypothetical protein